MLKTNKTMFYAKHYFLVHVEFANIFSVEIISSFTHALVIIESQNLLTKIRFFAYRVCKTTNYFWLWNFKHLE